MKGMKDYGRRERTAKASLSRHAARMAELEAGGMDRAEASRVALEEMTEKQRAATRARWGVNP